VLTANGTGGAFTYDAFGSSTNARLFVNGSDALVISNNIFSGGGVYDGNLGSGKGSISCLFRSLSGTNNSGQRFLFTSGGATAVTNGFGVFIENYSSGTAAEFGSLKIRFGNSSKPILFATNIVFSDWYYFAMTYDESISTHQVNWWLGQPGRTLNSGVLDFTAGSRAGQGNIFIIGNYTNFNARWASPGNGAIDEFAVWNRVLSSSEVASQFNALAPMVALPALAIAPAGNNVVLSWPSSTPSAYQLEATGSLSSPNWTNAGTATVVGNSYYVTNPITPVTQFFRLHKP
jgi:hypothetical protein